MIVNVHSSKLLLRAGYNPADQTIIIIHGFNGTEASEHMGYLRDGEKVAFNSALVNILMELSSPCTAYLSRHYNVIAVDWYRLTQYPCYITALANTRLVAQCTAQVSYWIVLHAISGDRVT